MGTEVDSTEVDSTAVDSTATDSTANVSLDARYGRTRERRIRSRVWAIVVGAAVLTGSIAWVVWVGLFQPSASLSEEDVGNTHTATTATVHWVLSIPAGHTATCAVEAQTASDAVVGWKLIHVPASTTVAREFTSTVRTSEPAVIGLIYSCWLT